MAERIGTNNTVTQSRSLTGPISLETATPDGCGTPAETSTTPTTGGDGAVLSSGANNAIENATVPQALTQNPEDAALRRVPGGEAAATGPVGTYHSTFGTQKYVADGANTQLLGLVGRAVQQFPELANTDLARNMDAGRLGESDIEALQTFLESKGHSVGRTGVDGKYGPRTHNALSALLNGQAPSPSSLGIGDTGPNVSALQDQLRERGFDPGRTDGQFGRKTRDALVGYQRSQGLPATGELDAATRARLETPATPQPGAEQGQTPPENVPIPQPRPADLGLPRTAPIPMPRPDNLTAASPPQQRHNLSERDIEMLTRAVAAEARGESPEVWTAVAQAIANYSRNTGRPIPELVRSSFLSSNQDHNAVYFTRPTGQIPNWDAMRQAAIAGANGESPIGNRDHFYDDSIRMPYWGDAGSRMQIGSMIFLNERRG